MHAVIITFLAFISASQRLMVKADCQFGNINDVSTSGIVYPEGLKSGDWPHNVSSNVSNFPDLRKLRDTAWPRV